MSEYQYYEFQAIDRPLSTADVKALRALSTRARITNTSFTNTYQWGNFKGDPARLMEQWFDLHLHLASWGTRCLMIRLPRRPATAPVAARRAGDLRARAEVIRQAREQAEAKKILAEQKQRDKAASRALRARLDETERRGDRVWAEIETEIQKRNVTGYDRTIFLLGDLKAIAEAKGTTDAFARRIADLRQRYARRYTFIERLDRL